MNEELDIELPIEESGISFTIFASIFFVIINLLYFIRILLECRVAVSVYMNTIESVHIAACMGAVILFLTSIYMKRAMTISFFDKSSFVDLTLIYQLDFFSNLMISLCALAYPFRVFLFGARYP